MTQPKKLKPSPYLRLEINKGRNLTYYFNFDFIKSVMELLIGKWHILIDALLGEATLPWIPLIRIPEYLAGLMKLFRISSNSMRMPD